MDLLRPLLGLAVLVLLARVARVAWTHRALTLALWRAVRWRHVVGGVGLFAAVAAVATALIVLVPGMDLGLGSLVGTSGNAVFAPLEAGLAFSPPPEAGPDWALLVGASLFLLPLTALLPWLAYVEEELFRAGLEHAGWGRVASASLGFGLLHLVMLVPLGAGLAIAVAGFAYAVVYRRGYADGDLRTTPVVAYRAFRATKRSAAAAERSRIAPTVTAAAATGAAHRVGRATSVTAIRDRTPERRQATGVFRAAVWHTTVNTAVVLAVWASMVWAAFDGTI